MRLIRRSLLLFHTDVALHRGLVRLGSLGFTVRTFANWADLANAAPNAGPSAVAVVDPYAGASLGSGPAEELADLRRRFPSLTVVVALGPRQGWLSDIRTLGEWGVAEVIDLTTEVTRESLVKRLTDARARPVRVILEGALELRSPQRARAILSAALEVVFRGAGPAALAKSIHVSPATLLRWCASSGLPVPRRLLMWLRVLLAGEMLDDPGRSVLDVAFSCGYSSDRALRRALHHTLGVGPQALRAGGAFATAVAAFRREGSSEGERR